MKQQTNRWVKRARAVDLGGWKGPSPVGSLHSPIFLAVSFFRLFPPLRQPRPQGFSLKKWKFKGKALGKRLPLRSLVPGYTAPSQAGRLRSSNLSIGAWTIASTQSPETCNPRSNIILTSTFGDSTVYSTFFRVSSPLGPTSRHDLPPQFWLHESHREYHGHMDNLLGFLYVLWFNFALGLISIFLCPILVIITLPNLVPRSHSVLY